MNLEIKHLAPYLPYNPKILNGWGDIKTLNYTYLDDENNGYIVGVKPLLNPISYLTKEIKVNGEMFIPIDKLQCLYEFEKSDLYGIRMYIDSGWTTSITELPYDLVQQLISWHFDIFGLIDAGLAVDINTVNF